MFYRMFYSLRKETEDLPTINIGKASSSSVTGGCAHNSHKGFYQTSGREWSLKLDYCYDLIYALPSTL